MEVIAIAGAVIALVFVAAVVLRRGDAAPSERASAPKPTSSPIEEEPVVEEEPAVEEEPVEEEREEPVVDEEPTVEEEEPGTTLADGGQPVDPVEEEVSVPADATILGVARQLESEEKYVEAAEAYEAMLLDDPADQRALRPLIELYDQLDAWAELQRTLYMLGDAIDDEERRLDLILQAAAVAQHKLEDAGTASAHYELVLRLDPDHEIARECLEALRDSGPQR